MTISASYVNGQFLEDALGNVGAFNLKTGAHQVMLVDETIAGQLPNDVETWVSATGVYGGNECPNSGDYNAGGDTEGALTSTLTSASSTLAWCAAHADTVWGGTSPITWATGVAPIGAGIYTTEAGVSGRIICAIKFGAIDIPVTSGTFTIAWNAAGIWTADYTPA